MRRAIREHAKDFIAIIVLFAFALLTTGIIFAKQGFTLPDWVPFAGSDRFELKAEFTTAQAVTRGRARPSTSRASRSATSPTSSSTTAPRW